MNKYMYILMLVFLVNFDFNIFLIYFLNELFDIFI